MKADTLFGMRLSGFCDSGDIVKHTETEERKGDNSKIKTGPETFGERCQVLNCEFPCAVDPPWHAHSE